VRSGKAFRKRFYKQEESDIQSERERDREIIAKEKNNWLHF